MNINRLLLDGSQLYSDRRCLCGASAAVVGVKRKTKKQTKATQLLFYVMLNTEFTSPPSCQCERAPVRYCQLHCWTRPSLACEELSKQLKFAGRICVWSHVLSQGASSLFPPPPQAQGNGLAAHARHVEIRGGRRCGRCRSGITDRLSRAEGCLTSQPLVTSQMFRLVLNPRVKLLLLLSRL